MAPRALIGRNPLTSPDENLNLRKNALRRISSRQTRHAPVGIFVGKVAVMSDDATGDFKDKQFDEDEVASKVVEQCEFRGQRRIFCWVMC